MTPLSPSVRAPLDLGPLRGPTLGVSGTRSRTALLVCAAALLACGWRQQHLDQHHGQSYDAAFAAQQGPARAPRAPVTGLDSQEAALISSTYRTSLAPKNAKVKDDPILVVAPPNRDRVAPLPPSVPK
jgi:hypothetical protein